jgi:hypothetical protein
MGNLLVGALAIVAAFLPSTLGYTAFGWAKDKGKSNFKSGLWGATAAIGSGIVAYFTLGSAMLAAGESTAGLGQIPATTPSAGIKNRWIRAMMNTQSSINWPYRRMAGLGATRVYGPPKVRTPWYPYIEGLGQVRTPTTKVRTPVTRVRKPWYPYIEGLGQVRTMPVRYPVAPTAKPWRPYIEGLGLISARRKKGLGLVDVSRRRVSGLGHLGKTCVGC